MTICDDDHDEVCYEGRICPMCEKVKEIAILKDDIIGLELELKKTTETK